MLVKASIWKVCLTDTASDGLKYLIVIWMIFTSDPPSLELQVDLSHSLFVVPFTYHCLLLSYRSQVGNRISNPILLFAELGQDKNLVSHNSAFHTAQCGNVATKQTWQQRKSRCSQSNPPHHTAVQAVPGNEEAATVRFEKSAARRSLSFGKSSSLYKDLVCI